MILDHLDETAGPDISLTPAHGAARRRVLRVVTMALGVAEKSVALNFERRRRAPEKHDPATDARIVDQITSTLAWVERACEDTRMLGDTLSQADITTVAAIGHVSRRHPELWLPEAAPKLAALATALEATPPFLACPFDD